jgi:predicted RNase H-like HicB family nuclease
MISLIYSVLISPLSAEDGGGFLATVPDLPAA